MSRENLGRLCYPLLLEEKRDLLLAESFDVEGAAGDEMFQVLDFLVRTGELAGAARDRPFLAASSRLAHHGRVERTRAAARELVRFRRFRALLHDDAQHLRDHVARTLDRHGVAEAHAEALDLVGVVQRRVLHDHSADSDRLELGHRRERAGAPNLDIDVFDHGRCLLGGEFVRDRPARIARHEAEPLLPVEAVNLVDDTVDVVIERPALRFDLVMEHEHGVDRVADLHQGIDLEPAGGKPLDHAGLGLSRHRAHFAPTVGEEPERPRSGDCRIELPQRARGGVARIGEDLLPSRPLPLVQREESGFGHVHLAAHLADLGRVLAAQLFGNVGERSHIRGDVLAFRAVAAGRAAHQTAVLVAQRAGEAVDLRLGREHRPLVRGQTQKSPHPLHELSHLGISKGIAERKHRYGVTDFGKFLRRLGADAARGRIRPYQRGKPPLDLLVAPTQRVIGGVRYRRRVFLVVAPVVRADLGCEPL